MPGRLIVCATPIGNLGDVTLRVLDALRDADTIAAEDTRITRRLLSRYDLHTPLERFDEHTARQRTPVLRDRVADGECVALVSDAGTPGISDPGHTLVEACLDAELAVDVLPGPSAITTALVASGLPTDRFYFGGFLPRKEGDARRALGALSRLDATLVFYESPRRAAVTLGRIAEELPGRDAVVARELTKVHEEVVRGRAAELAESLASRELKGEVVLVIAPPPAEVVEYDPAELRSRLDELLATGISVRDAVRRVSEETGAPRNLVYETAHADRN